MFHLHKATHVTVDTASTTGGPSGPPADDAALQRWLAGVHPHPAGSGAAGGPHPDAPFVRANMVTSVDGAVSVDDLSGGLGGRGDKLLFHTLRGLADVVLVGAGTAVTEGYGQPDAPPALAEVRRDHGQREAPALALVSRSLSVPADYAPLSHPDTVILTCASAPADRRAELRGAGATLVDCGDDTVETSAMLAACAERGWMRVLCEGGPTLLGTMIADDALDELCVTTSPSAVAGRAGRMATHDAAVLQRLRPEVILSDDDGFVYTRWVRRERSAPRH